MPLLVYEIKLKTVDSLTLFIYCKRQRRFDISLRALKKYR